MIAVARFLSLTEAELAKLALQKHAIFCELSGENAHLYGGAPFAMPVLLLVADDELDEAREILRNTPHQPALVSPRQPKLEKEKNDPWEIPGLAGLLLLPAITLLLQRHG